MPPPTPPPAFLITIDVEDWFQVENFKSKVPFQSWHSRQLRVEKNVHRLLDLLDTANGQRPTDNGRQRKLQATFFVLGWIADRLPSLVREINARGHEVASHGYNHELCTTPSRDDLRHDLIRSKKLLEDILDASVTGYRAPSFSVTDDILKLIKDCGYRYDSSYNSFRLNSRYGKISLNGSGRKEIVHQITDNFYELPVSNLKLPHIELPLGGGGYFRLIPFPAFKMGVNTILKRDHAYLFYLHPWELDPHQPRVDNVPSQYKFRHYTNLNRTAPRLLRLIEAFHTCRFISCSHYLGRLFPDGTAAIGEKI